MKTLLLLLIAGTLLVAACSGDDSSPRPQIEVKLGIVQSLTGAGAVYGQTVVKGMELAVKEINDNNALQAKEQCHGNGSCPNLVHITTTVIDDKSTVDDGKTAFSTLVSQGTTAILGPTLSSVAFEAQKIAQAASIPVLGVTNTAEGITDTGDYVFRVSLTEAVVVPAAIQAAAKTTSVKRGVLVLDSSDAFSRSSADAMRRGISMAGGSVVAEVDIAQDANVLPRLAAVSDGFDVLLVTPLVDKSAAVLKAARGAGYTQPVIGGNSFNTLEIARLAGDTVEGAYVGASWNPTLDLPASKRFVAAYKAAYGSEPDQFAAQGYTSVLIVASAVGSAGTTDGRAVRDLIARWEADTPLGALSFDAKRNAVHPPVVQRYKGGALVVSP